MLLKVILLKEMDIIINFLLYDTFLLFNNNNKKINYPLPFCNGQAREWE